MVLLVFLMISTSLQAYACHNNIKMIAPDSRYTLQSGGTEVLDNTTQLVWKRCVEGFTGDNCETGSAISYDWSDALELADSTWRLPNIKELSSLVETACYSPTINLMIFPNTPSSGIFWSSTPSYEGGVWNVSFYNGNDSTNGRSSNLYVRLVRNGQ